MADQSTNSLMMGPKPSHLLHQIAETPTHESLLKQWLKEEELTLNRLALKETQIDSVRIEIMQLYIFFFLFHSHRAPSPLQFLLQGPSHGGLSQVMDPIILFSPVLHGDKWAARYKMEVEGHLEKMLEREKEDGKLLGKCAEELKKKGVEVDALRRAESMRMEVKVVRKWSIRDYLTLLFFTVSCLVLGLTRVILCS